MGHEDELDRALACMDEVCSGSAEAIDRWDALDARGIEAQIFEVVGGERHRLVW
jgi:hypothetical protein